MKNVRISHQLYVDAARVSAMEHRSIAQQIEHWAAIGQQVESQRQASLSAFLRIPGANVPDFSFVPPHLVKEFKVSRRADDF